MGLGQDVVFGASDPKLARKVVKMDEAELDEEERVSEEVHAVLKAWELGVRPEVVVFRVGWGPGHDSRPVNARSGQEAAQGDQAGVSESVLWRTWVAFVITPKSFYPNAPTRIRAVDDWRLVLRFLGVVTRVSGLTMEVQKLETAFPQRSPESSHPARVSIVAAATPTFPRSTPPRWNPRLPKPLASSTPSPPLHNPKP